jgi:pimeloyl-ACP methyl ester carboxylesterase
MPILETVGFRIEYSEAGAGAPVVLVHGSVSGNRQWKSLVQELEPHFRVLAPNLFGYGETSRWQEEGSQTIADQANLIISLAQQFPGPIRLVGHSFGGSVALKVATMLGGRISHLFLFEPNPFYLLAQNGRAEAYAEAIALRDFIKSYGAKGDWVAVAERFVDYWLGDGAWAVTPEKRRLAYLQLLRPNYYEWDCMESDETEIENIARMSAKAMLVYSAGARRPTREIARLFEERCPNWSVATIAEGGHMAPLTHPHLVNPLVSRFLRDEQSSSSSFPRDGFPTRAARISSGQAPI